MQQFTNAIKNSIENKNWFAGLFLALCMPEICAKIETPSDGESQKHYTRWFNDNLAKVYGKMFSADDCYYFRCACLHQGLDTHAKLSFERIHFITPFPNKNIVHKNIFNGVLQMQIDIFCIDVASAVDSWYENIVKKDINMQSRVDGLIKIYGPESLKPIISFES